MNKEIKTQEDYISFLSTKKQFIMQHLLKLFYYWNKTESDNLYNQGWTKYHWMNEIVDIIDINGYNFDCIKSENQSALFNALYVNPDYNNCIKYLTDLMARDYEFKVHKLPKIPKITLYRKWNSFCVAYRIFIETVVNRLLYSNSKISRNMIFNFWNSMAKKCSKKEDKMRDVSEKYSNFSELTERLLILLKNEGLIK